MRERETDRKQEMLKEESGLEPGRPILDQIKSFTAEQNSTTDHSDL